MAAIVEAAEEAGTPSAPTPSIPRAQRYDRESAEIKDNVLRMGALVETQIRAAIDALVTPRRRRCPRRSSSTTGRSTRSSARRRR